MLNKEFDDWYNSLPDGEPTYQMTFEAGQRFGEIKATNFKEFSKLAGRAMNDAYEVIDTIEPETDSEGDRLYALLRALRDLTDQAYGLNGVMSASQLKNTEGKL